MKTIFNFLKKVWLFLVDLFKGDTIKNNNEQNIIIHVSPDSKQEHVKTEEPSHFHYQDTFSFEETNEFTQEEKEFYHDLKFASSPADKITMKKINMKEYHS